ncbi:hypothetical protein [Nonomuraea sp. NPDC050783]|uniref:hypothetical protein n=1 Tax=Nonomuraea sp. NPDC050783 TaxID=3154634 RepID=UPI0034673BAD
MVIETILLTAVAALTVVQLVVELILKFRQIAEWFRERRSRLYGNVLNTADRERVGFTLQDLMANGQYRTVQGVFNTATEQVETDVRQITSRGIDAELAAHHQNRRLVIYP